MKKLIIIVTAVFVLFMQINQISAKNEYELYSQTAFFYDASSGQVLYEKNADKKMYPASMTKIMTAYVALEKITDLNAKVKITYKDTDKWFKEGASVAGFMPGEYVTYRDLLYGALFPSGADACYALGRTLYGSEEACVKEMNKVCKKLGMKSTHFMNTSGLHHPEHYSTCRDMVKILEEAYKNNNFKTIFNGRKYTASGKKLIFASTLRKNNLSSGVDIKYINGAKSGYTPEAKHCLASAYEYQGHKLFGVTGGAGANNLGKERKVRASHIIDANNVYRHIVLNKKLIHLYDKGETINNYRVLFSKASNYRLKSMNEISVFVDKSVRTNNIKVKIKGNHTLKASIYEGTYLGRISVYDGSKEQAYIPIYIKRSYPFDQFSLIMFIIKMTVLVLLIIMLLIIGIKKKMKRKKKASH